MIAVHKSEAYSRQQGTESPDWSTRLSNWPGGAEHWSAGCPRRDPAVTGGGRGTLTGAVELAARAGWRGIVALDFPGAVVCSAGTSPVPLGGEAASFRNDQVWSSSAVFISECNYLSWGLSLFF